MQWLAESPRIGVSAQTGAQHAKWRFRSRYVGTIVNRDGVVCAVAFTGGDRGDQWPGSRVISAQKANTGNAFSLPGLVLSTANLFSAVSPGGSLYGLQHSNPVATQVAYRGNAANYGQANDPMVGFKIGGINVFGGGFALYNGNGEIVGGLGVSGDSSCADHNIGWKTRHSLRLDFVPGGVSGDAARPDNIVYDITSQPGQQEGISESGWGHPACSTSATSVAATLPVVRKVQYKLIPDNAMQPPTDGLPPVGGRALKFKKGCEPAGIIISAAVVRSPASLAFQQPRAHRSQRQRQTPRTSPPLSSRCGP